MLHAEVSDICRRVPVKSEVYVRSGSARQLGRTGVILHTGPDASELDVVEEERAGVCAGIGLYKRRAKRLAMIEADRNFGD